MSSEIASIIGSSLVVPDSVRSRFRSLACQYGPEGVDYVPPTELKVSHLYDDAKAAYNHLLPKVYGQNARLLGGCVIDEKAWVGLGEVSHPRGMTKHHFTTSPTLMGALLLESGQQLSGLVINQHEKPFRTQILTPVQGPLKYANPIKFVPMETRVHVWSWVLPIKETVTDLHFAMVVTTSDNEPVYEALGSGYGLLPAGNRARFKPPRT